MIIAPGLVAQLVEQRIEHPRVAASISLEHIQFHLGNPFDQDQACGAPRLALQAAFCCNEGLARSRVSVA
jgi:hypothetical protein